MRTYHVGRMWHVPLGVSFALGVALSTAHAQDTRITGHVQDAAEHVAIPTAAVVVTGTTIGANTSDSGTFSFRVPPTARSMTVRRIGYLAQVVPLTPGKTDYTIVLQKDVLRLETQVVTGVATSVASQNAANAVSVVNTTDINQVPAPTMENSLQGKIPGAVIQQNNGGAPGGGLSIQVRGVTSIFGNALPLYIVDGVVVNNETVEAGDNAINQSGGGVNSIGSGSGGANQTAPGDQDNSVNRIADLNPDDIESLEVLKGASASAIYGSKASAGVVIITTKRGTSGKAKWTVSNQVGHTFALQRVPDPHLQYAGECRGLAEHGLRGQDGGRQGRQQCLRLRRVRGTTEPAGAAVQQPAGVLPDEYQCEREFGSDAVLSLWPVQVRQRDAVQHGLQQAVRPDQRRRAIQQRPHRLDEPELHPQHDPPRHYRERQHRD